MTQIDGYSLTPFTGARHAEIAHRLNDPEVWQPYNWFGFEYPGVPMGAAHMGQFGESGILALVDAEHKTAGQVQWIKGFWYGGPNQHRAWNIGLIVLPEYRRTRATQAAVRLLIDYLFTHTTAHRIEMTTPAEAAPARESFRPGGMTREGTFRKAQWREGQWHDMAMFAVLRDEWEQPDRAANTPPGQR